MLRHILQYLFPPQTQELLVRHATEIPSAPKTLLIANTYPVETLTDYRNSITRALIMRMKYHKDVHATQVLGRALAEALLEVVADAHECGRIPIVVPIPSSSQRVQERGFNHLETLCEEMGRTVPSLRPYIRYDILKKRIHSSSQTTHTKRARRENVRGTFTCISRESLGTQGEPVIIIIDDVITTGATMHEAFSILTRAGFVHLSAIAIARATHTA